MTKSKTRRGFGGIPKKAKPSQGVSGALVSMSKDLINPTNGLAPIPAFRSRSGSFVSEGEEPVASVAATTATAFMPTESPVRKKGRKRGLTATSKTSEKSENTTYPVYPPVASPSLKPSVSNRLSFTSTENGVNRTRASSIYATSDQDMYVHSSSAPESERTDGEDGEGWSEGDHNLDGYPAGDDYHSVGPTDRTRSGSMGSGNFSNNYTHNNDPNGNHDEDDDEDHHEMSGSESGGSGQAEYDLDDLPVVGFAVASVKRNSDFHALFGKVIPEDDYLIEDYGCALQRDILLQGRLYVSENHICFHANIFGWVTNLVVPFSETNRIDKKMTAFVIPNAIMITTSDAKHTFASFLSRDTAFDVIHSIWRLSTPINPMAANRSSSSIPDDSPLQSLTSNSLATDSKPAHQHSPSSPLTMGKKKIPSRKQPTTCQCQLNGGHYSETALDSVFPSTPEKLYNLMFTSGFSKDFMSNNQKLIDIQISDWAPQSSGSHLLTRSMSYIKPLPGGFGPKQTKCELVDQTAHVDFQDFVSMITTTRTPDVPSGGSFAVKTRTCLMWAGANSTRVVVTTQVDWTGRSFIKGIIESSALAGQKSTHGDLEIAMRTYIADHRTEFHTEGVDDGDDLQESTLLTIDPGSNSGPADSSSAVHSNNLSSSGNDSSIQNHKDQERALLQYSFDLSVQSVFAALRAVSGIVQSILTALTDISVRSGVMGAIVGILVISNIWTLVSLRGARDGIPNELASKSGYEGTNGADATGRIRPRSVLRHTGFRCRQSGKLSVERPAQNVEQTQVGMESPDSVAEAVRLFLEDYLPSAHPQSRPPTYPHLRSLPRHEQFSALSPQEEIEELRNSLDDIERWLERLRKSVDHVVVTEGAEEGVGSAVGHDPIGQAV
ncbi:Uncharacterized conserved protein, contains GRAM domain [Phaffia rhodozyma]|uniref:Uncharacterized conserved protein, contains GRAM domain n=1 Tax=Phaffia rhodozyma TaxID=264483 RepID=A0A0F7SRT4_PHARH|nr:Uncharacterized conserved protein, contains GRAM domain [Phaffia rhodozyma]